MKEEPLLKAENIEEYYGKIHALKGIDLEMNSGEIVGLIGGNGAGKSTFAKIVCGDLSPSGGRLFWKGKEVEINSIKKARELGIEIVFQEQALADGLNIIENIFLGREKTRLGPIKMECEDEMREKTENALDELELNVPANQEVRFCSGGERQGAAVARSILFEANLIILDEPTRALAPEGVERVLTLIDNLTEKDIGVIYITHSLSNVISVADRFVIMSRGEIKARKKNEDISPENLAEIM